jgi:glycosyltransferase involved in cell wall biosynthesis
MNLLQPVKVLFIASSYPRSKDDAASVFLRYLAEHLVDDGVDVHVLAPADRKGETVIESKVTVHRFQYCPAGLQKLAYGSGMLPNLKRAPWLWFQVPFFLMAMAYSLLRLLATQRFDVIHAHWILPQGLVGLAAARLFRVPLIVSVHGTDAFALRRRFARILKYMVVRCSTAWTANTASTAAAVVQGSRLPQTRIIPMGVDIALFSSGNPAALRDQLPEGELLILFVGRLIESKGCHDLLRAVSLLASNIRSRTTLWIIGDGDQKLQLERAAQDSPIGEKVRFFGAVNQQRLPDFYAAADLMVMPSKLGSSGEAEGQGIVVLEAFAARACVVATHIGGITSIVRDRVTGVLVEPDNPIALSSAIEELLNEPALRKRMRETAFSEVCERYSWIRTASEFNALYSEIVGPVRRRSRL